jgi:hypothetical protein
MSNEEDYVIYPPLAIEDLDADLSDADLSDADLSDADLDAGPMYSMLFLPCSCCQRWAYGFLGN